MEKKWKKMIQISWPKKATYFPFFFHFSSCLVVSLSRLVLSRLVFVSSLSCLVFVLSLFCLHCSMTEETAAAAAADAAADGSVRACVCVCVCALSCATYRCAQILCKMQNVAFLIIKKIQLFLLLLLLLQLKLQF